MTARLKVLLAVPELQDLGVQHDVRCLMRHWNRERFEPIMLLHKRVGRFADQFPPELASFQVDERSLDVRGIRIVLRVIGYARTFRELRPDAVISFVPYSNVACSLGRSLGGWDFGLAVSEHAHVTASMRDPEGFKGGFLWFYQRAFPAIYNRRADLVKCIAEESRRDLIENHGIAAERTRLIYNPVDFEEVRSLGREPADHSWFEEAERRKTPILISVGRLRHQKRQDILLKAFALVRAGRPLRLAFVGQGPHLERLQTLAASLGIAEDVIFLGFQRNPWRYMARSDILVVSSEWEGLPCVITEAMALAIPVVSTRCPSGPSEMLLEGEAGLLCRVEDPDDLARAITEALENPVGTRQRVAVATKNLSRFEPGAITRRYEELAQELAALGRERRGTS